MSGEVGLSISDWTDDQWKQYWLDKVEYEIYRGSHVFEEIECDGRLRGNGHHMRQNLVKTAQAEVLRRWVVKK